MDLLRLFVYGILKRGYWNHDPFCRAFWKSREARIRGCLYEGPGFPLLKVPDWLRSSENTKRHSICRGSALSGISSTVVATHQTSLFDELGQQQSDFQLADLFGISHRYLRQSRRLDL